jgi:hypothetical protein
VGKGLEKIPQMSTRIKKMINGDEKESNQNHANGQSRSKEFWDKN